MASHRRDNDQTMFTTKTPHFSTIIRHETIQDGKLEIPEYFVRKFGNRLPRTIQLKVAGGETWHVDLKECDQKVWLHQGWREFAEHFSLVLGQFLVFRYQGNVAFHVLIFDRTATEIEYPHSNTEEEEEEEALECKKRKEKSDEPCLQPNKRVKVDSVKNKSNGTNSNSVRKGKGVRVQRARRMAEDERVKALEKTSGFRSKYPFFMVVMQPMHINKYRVSIPVTFARKHLMKITHGTMIQCIWNGQKWHAKYCCYDKKYPQPELYGANWGAFAKHADLQVGDVCIFELTKTRPEVVLRVVIYPVDRDASAARFEEAEDDVIEILEETPPCKRMKVDSQNEAGTNSKSKVLASNRKGRRGFTGQRSPQIEAPRRARRMMEVERAKALQKASGFRSKNPFFMIVIKPLHVNGFRMSIPISFAREHLMKIPNGTMIQCVWNGQKWPAKYCCLYDMKYPQPQLRGGNMVAFSKHAALQVGDVCFFELTKMSPEVVFKIVIYPVDKDANAARSPEEAEDDVIEILEETHPCKKMRERSPFQCHRPPKDKKTNMTNKSENILEAKSVAKEIKVKRLKRSACSSSSKQGDGFEACKRTGKGMGYGLECPEQAVILSFKLLSDEDKAKTLEIAKSFKWRNPFFLAIIQPSHTKHYMFIPNTFAKKFFTKVPGGKATLRLSNGKSWPVQYARRACKENPKAQFWAGWKKFALDNRLAVGNICVFELLEGAKMTLKVVIYRVADVAKAASRGRNSVLFNNEKQKQPLDYFQNSLDKEEAEDDDIEILDETPPCKKMRKRSPCQCHRSLKNKKTNMTTKSENILEAKSLAPRLRSYGNKATDVKVEKLKRSGCSSSSKHGDGKGMGNGWECPEKAAILRFKEMPAEEKAKTLRIADSFNSGNPFFLAIIQPSHIYYMSIPNNFARKFLTKTPTGKTTLCLPNGKSWPVEYKIRPCQDDNSRAYFSSGWSKFALDNRLVAGDICVFELLHQGAKITLQVVIHRIADAAKGFPKRNPYLSSQAPEAAASKPVASDSPFFTKTIMPSSLDHHGRMSIPFEFIEKHFKPNTKNVILQVADKLWSVKLDKNCRKGRLSSGWLTFARENTLEVGDFCVFKLIITSRNNAVLNVFISRRHG